MSKDCPTIVCLLCHDKGHKAMVCPKATPAARARFIPPTPSKAKAAVTWGYSTANPSKWPTYPDPYDMYLYSY